MLGHCHQWPIVQNIMTQHLQAAQPDGEHKMNAEEQKGRR